MVWFPNIFHKSLTVKIPTYKMMNRPTNFTLQIKKEHVIYLYTLLLYRFVLLLIFFFFFLSLYKISVIMTVHLKKA